MVDAELTEPAPTHQLDL